jgi:hypothetical protein
MEKFFDMHKPALLWYLTRRLGPDDGAEVLSQAYEEFFVWWSDNPEHPNPVATVSAWGHLQLQTAGRRLTMACRLRRSPAPARLGGLPFRTWNLVARVSRTALSTTSGNDHGFR